MSWLIIKLLMFTSLSFAQSVEPGVWQSNISFEINGLHLPESAEKECIPANDAKDIKSRITKELEQQGCTATKWTAKGEKVEVSLKCKSSGLDATGNMRGTVASKNYDLKGEAEGNYQGLPAEATIVLKGKWLKACEKK